MEERLTKTWQVLVGEDLSFSAQAICNQALLAQHYFVVTKPFNTEILTQAVLSVLQDADSLEDAIETAAEPGTSSVKTATASPTSAAEIARLLSLSSIICKVESIEPVPIDQIKRPYVFGVYSSAGSKAVDAVCLMDLNAAAMIGGALSNLSAAEVKTAR